MNSTIEQDIHTVEIRKSVMVNAPIEITFQSILDEMGPEGQMPDGTPFPLKLEAWPGGRWYRDLGNSAGHLWGHVQVIKPPKLLEIVGPMFMSYPVASHFQYRLTPEGNGTHLVLVHKAMGLIPQDDREGMQEGWNHGLKRVKEIAERKKR